MSTENTEYEVDRAGWKPGSWDSEPDKLQWTDETTGLPCLIVRNRMGALCGYVAVDESHPMYRKPYDDVSADVHGGLTYSDACQGRICHIPEPGKPDNVWWLGFDCAHCNDLIPSLSRMDECYEGDIYRDVDYVRSECTSLAKQLHDIAPESVPA